MPASDTTEYQRENPKLRRYTSPLSQLVLAVLVGSGLIVLIFGAYEIIERTWLSHLENEALRLLHGLRGIFTALVVAVTVGWVVIRSSPALLAVTSAETGEPNFAERERLYAHWFIAMRWIAVLVAFLLVFLSVQVFSLLPSEALWPLMVTILVLAGFNVGYTLSISRIQKFRPMLIFQGYVDLVILAALLHFAGGIENPLAILILFHVVIGGILISQAECYRMAAAGSLLFAVLAIGTAANLLPHYPLELYPNASTTAARIPFSVGTAVGVHTAILFLTAYFVTTLAERLRQNEVRLATMAESAQAEHHLLEQALETTSAGLRVMSPDLAECWANDHWKQWFGSGTCHGCPTPDRSQCACAIESLRSGKGVVLEIKRPGNGIAVETGNHSAPGEKVFQVTSAPILDTHGAVTRIAQLAQDVTAQKQAHARMMRAGQMAAVGELAGQVAHEVNNPIAIISAKTNLLLSNRRDEMSDKIAQELEKITDLSNRVARIAQGLLSYCRPSPSAHRPLDLRLSIRKSLAMIEQRAAANNISIDDTLPDKAITVPGNAGELEQVFLNLLLNAIHAMPAGGRLSISMQEAAATDAAPGQRVGIAVDDSGPGVPVDIRERIFEPFFTTRTEGKGTGLGLSICQGLIRTHGGEVTIGSAPDGGARFTVWLPLEELHSQPLEGKES